MKHSMKRIALLAIAAASLLPGLMHAQFVLPYHATAGINTATAEARTRLGDDASLVLIGAVGELEASGMPIRFYPDNGESDAWAYVFYSPAKKRHGTIPVISIPGMEMTAVDAPSPVPIPNELTTPLDMTLPFADSDRMIERLNGDTIYSRYRRELPNVLPQTIAYRTMLSDDSLILPQTFPLDAPVWSMTFAGGGDSMMLCYVSGRTGETFCLRVEGTASVSTTEEREAMRISSVIGATGRSGVKITPVEGAGPAVAPTIALFDLTGRHIPLSVVERHSGSGWVMEFESEELPEGYYFCRVTGEGWSRTIGIVR